MQTVSDRVRSLFRIRSIPGYGLIILVLDALGYIHLAAFIKEQSARVMDLIQAHPIVVFGIGILWLTGVVFWPSLKHFLPEMPKTIHERVESLDERVEDVQTRLSEVANLGAEVHETKQSLLHLMDLQHKLAEQHGQMQTLTSERVGILEEDRTKAIKERSDLTIRLTHVENKAFDAINRLDEHRPWISDLSIDLNKLKAKTTAALEQVPTFSLFMIEVSRLIAGADATIGILFRIKDYLPQSEAAKAPFSQRWLARDLLPTPEPLVVGWAFTVERHIGQCCEFAVRFKIGQSRVLDNAFQLYVHGWNQSASMESCIQILSSQRAKLLAFRDDYAADFALQVERATIS